MHNFKVGDLVKIKAEYRHSIFDHIPDVIYEVQSIIALGPHVIKIRVFNSVLGLSYYVRYFPFELADNKDIIKSRTDVKI